MTTEDRQAIKAARDKVARARLRESYGTAHWYGIAQRAEREYGVPNRHDRREDAMEARRTA